MKIILRLLFVIQLCVLFFYSVVFFRGDCINQLINTGTTVAQIDFHENLENFRYFLDMLSQKDVELSRVVWRDVEAEVIIYTTDVTLSGQVVLQDGRLPSAETAEFISTTVTGEENQVGVLRVFIPDLDLTISSIQNPQNFALNGMYHLHTIDSDILNEISDVLSDREIDMIVLQSHDSSAHPLHLLMMGLSSASIYNIYEFGFLGLVLFLCVLFSIVQYAINQLKTSSILYIHGFSSFSVMKHLTGSLLKILSLSVVIAYIVSMVYSFYMNYHVFFIPFTLFFLIISGGLMLFYVFILNLVAFAHLKSSDRTLILKGKKEYSLVQIFNHLLRAGFMVLFLNLLFFSANQGSELYHRLSHSTYWETARNNHRIIVDFMPTIDNAASRIDTYHRQIELYQSLTENHGGFIMDSQNIWFLDIDWMPYEDMTTAPSLRISPNGYRVTISPNFLNLNPITAVNGIDIQEQIVWNDHVLNLLVPEELQAYEADIVASYLYDFYFRHVGLTNGYHREVGLDPIETTVDDLSIHIIYVLDQQYYFSFNPTLRPETGGRILDPIAVIHTGNLHGSDLSAWFTHSMYFYSEAIDAYDAIFPDLLSHGLQSVVQRVSPVYNEYVNVVHDLQARFIRLIGFIILLIIASFAITYHLVANYFEVNKFKLTIKRNFGYHGLRRNKNFILVYLSYLSGAVVVTSIFRGWQVLIVGLVMILLDIFVIFLFERHLMKKSFSEIIKGER